MLKIESEWWWFYLETIIHIQRCYRWNFEDGDNHNFSLTIRGLYESVGKILGSKSCIRSKNNSHKFFQEFHDDIVIYGRIKTDDT